MAWGRKQSKDELGTVEQKAVPSKIAPRDSRATPPTILGAAIDVTGEIKSDKDMLILGQVKGKIQSTAQVLIGESGKVEGGIKCKTLVIDGQVVGNVEATEQVTINNTGSLTGDITTKLFINQPGGFFEGYSHMIQKEGPGNAETKDKTTAGSKGLKKEGKSK